MKKWLKFTVSDDFARTLTRKQYKQLSRWLRLTAKYVQDKVMEQIECQAD